MSDDSDKTLPPLGGIIFIAFKPLIKLMIPAIAGAFLQKSGLLTQSGLKSVSQIILNIFLPSLLFSKLVPSITQQNLSEIGVLVLVAAFYQLSNAIAGLFLRAVVEVPPQFRHGFLAAAIFSNWGDLPTAVIQTITQSRPFSGTADSDLAIAYISIFILMNNILLWPMRGTYLIAMDYIRSPPETAKGRTRRLWRRITYGYDGRITREMALRGNQDVTEDVDMDVDRTHVHTPTADIDVESFIEEGEGKSGKAQGIFELHAVNSKLSGGTLENRRAGPSTSIPLPSPPVTPPQMPIEIAASQPPSKLTVIKKNVISILKPMLAPPCLSLFIGLLVAFVPTLKALFVYIEEGPHIKPAPDGTPPLATLLDSLSFLGNAQVPCGLIVLGATIASMKIERPFTQYPLVSIVGLAVYKLVLLPILGVALSQGLTKAGIVDSENKVLRFVLMYFSCVPTATTQVIFSQVFAPPGKRSNAEILGAYLIVQYIILMFSSVILTAFLLSLLF